MGRTALITGITRQDGSYLAELLLAKGMWVYGLVRRSSVPNTGRIQHILPDITLLNGDITDQSSLMTALQIVAPDEIYNLAAQSHVGTSFIYPLATMETTGLGVTKLLEALRLSGGKARFYQASTSEIIGQENQTIFAPRSPYACAKLYAHWTVINYRQAYNLYACSGILYNHESPRRGHDFVTRKITRAVARIKYGLQDRLILGNISSYRDWGFAGDYVRAMHLMLQQDEPRDHIIATGHTHSVADFVAKAFEYAGISDWRSYLEIDAQLYRPSDVDMLIGNPSGAREALGWEPHVSFDELVQMMVEHDLREVSKHAIKKGIFQDYHTGEYSSRESSRQAQKTGSSYSLECGG